MADLVNEKTGKQRGARIRLDHYKGWDGPTSAKWIGAGVAAALCLVVLVWVLSTTSGGVLVSHGPLSQAHALWDSKCDACHAPGSPLRFDAVALGGATTEQRCISCHFVYKHHNQPQDTDRQCAACHQEHRGREADINRVADSACTVCHADLTPFTTDGATPKIAEVSSFVDDHPEFRSLPDDTAAGDPGTLGFTHSRHMALGLVSFEGSTESEIFRYKQIPAEDRDRYMRLEQDAADAVQLNCASCHELQSASASDGGVYSAAGGGVFLPIRYEQHCRACHPLSVTTGQGAGSLAHGLSAEEIDERLEGALRSEWFDANEELATQPPPRAIPGRPQVLRDNRESAQEEVDRKLPVAEDFVYDQCVKCHEMQGDLLAIQPTNVPAVWLKKSYFSHSPHRAISCKECHAGVYAPPPAGLALVDRKRESDAVHIPGKENCLQCHAPPTSTGGGVRHDCALCHRYHDLERRPMRMPDLMNRGESESVERFLDGFPSVRTPE